MNTPLPVGDQVRSGAITLVDEREGAVAGLKRKGCLRFLPLQPLSPIP